MCESVPRECLPPPGQTLHRRSVVTGVASLFLMGCMPTSTAQRRREAMATAPHPVPSQPRGGQPRPAPRMPRPPAYEIVRRAAWGAEPLKDNHDPMPRITRLTVHHTAEIAGMGERPDADLVKGIQNFHRNTRDWADIGYHWIIGQDGKVYEGRALHVQGAHAGGGNNKENLGISIIGDFTATMPPTPAIRTLTLFLRAQQKRYRIPMDQVFGHREFKATACPGDMLFAWLERYRATV